MAVLASWSTSFAHFPGVAVSIPPAADNTTSAGGSVPIDVDTAVQELTDRTAITDVLHTYARLVDERDFAGAAGVFTDDCLAEYGLHETEILHSSAAVADWLTRRLP